MDPVLTRWLESIKTLEHKRMSDELVKNLSDNLRRNLDPSGLGAKNCTPSTGPVNSFKGVKIGKRRLVMDSKKDSEREDFTPGWNVNPMGTPLPDGHPFKGFRIIFGQRPNPTTNQISEKPTKNKNTSDIEPIEGDQTGSRE